MDVGNFKIFIIAAAALLLVYAAWTDIRSRRIEHWNNAAVALLAPAYWWASGLEIWPDLAVQIGIALIVFGIFAGVFMIGAMGGGDVKLIGALALWFPFSELLGFLLIMAMAGGVLTVFMLILYKYRKSQANIEVPYGVAISFAALWVLFAPYINHLP